ncbi:hypothetical protein J6590_041048 [Homalodisca vitripennis]|nr:hypothetical protein J6590_041048 [Homalodisca vitripennis]
MSLKYHVDSLKKTPPIQNKEDFRPNNDVQVQSKPKRTRQTRKISENWADNQRKIKRNSGQEYLTPPRRAEVILRHGSLEPYAGFLERVHGALELHVDAKVKITLQAPAAI